MIKTHRSHELSETSSLTCRMTDVIWYYYFWASETDQATSYIELVKITSFHMKFHMNCAL